MRRGAIASVDGPIGWRPTGCGDIGGSVASFLLGEARSTLDIDIVAALRDADAVALATALEGDYYLSFEGTRAASRSTRSTSRPW